MFFLHVRGISIMVCFLWYIVCSIVVIVWGPQNYSNNVISHGQQVLLASQWCSGHENKIALDIKQFPT